MELLLLLGLFLVVIGLATKEIDEKKVRRGKLISCIDLDESHEWVYNAKNELECCVCYAIAGERSDEENY